MIITHNSEKSGFLLINKPIKWTSFDVVAKLRNITKIKKIGHAGTLDPLAEGLLIVAIGRKATKQIDSFIKKPKEYITTMHLGATSDTFDLEGAITENACPEKIPSELINRTLKQFIGQQEQIPPMHSAKKVNGVKLYKLARKGKEIKREASKIQIFTLQLIAYCWPELTIKINCSTGTYVRTLGNDIGTALGCGAYLTKLKRTSIGEYKLKEAHDIKSITPENWDKQLINPSQAQYQPD